MTAPIIGTEGFIPKGRDAEKAAIMYPSRSAARAPSRRVTTMGSRITGGKHKEPVYPMFLDLSKQCAEIDVFWSRFFETMAMGRFPKGVILREDSLVHHTRKTTTSFQLTQERKSDWQKVADFFRETCEIRSGRDWELRKPKEQAVVHLTTAEINKRVKRENANAIPEFVNQLKRRYDLNVQEMNDLDGLLRYYSSSNLFRPGDVIYGSSGMIKEIKTLAFDEEARSFSITAEAKAPRYTMKESYQDLITYLSMPPFSKSTERKGGFDMELRKQLVNLYPKIKDDKRRIVKRDDGSEQEEAEPSSPLCQQSDDDSS